MESNRLDYPVTDALADAGASQLDAARLLTQPLWVHAGRGVVAAIALSAMAVPHSWMFFLLLALAGAGTALVEFAARRATGVRSSDSDSRAYWPGNRRVISIVAVLAVIAIGIFDAVDFPLPVRVLPAICYGVAWVVIAVRSDQERLQDAGAPAPGTRA